MVSPTDQPTTRTSTGEIIMSESESEGITSLIHDEQGNVRVNVFFPDYNIQVSSEIFLLVKSICWYFSLRL